MKYILIFLIKAYRLFSKHFPLQCRFTPTCSQYALEAVERYGAIKGFVMAVWRIARCNPFSAGGYDPVPLVSKRK
jgi:putative membrane protein insertion efficiency factor